MQVGETLKTKEQRQADVASIKELSLMDICKRQVRGAKADNAMKDRALKPSDLFGQDVRIGGTGGVVIMTLPMETTDAYSRKNTGSTIQTLANEQYCTRSIGKIGSNDVLVAIKIGIEFPA